MPSAADLAVEILRLEDLPPPLPARAVKQAELGVKLARLVLESADAAPRIADELEKMAAEAVRSAP